MGKCENEKSGYIQSNDVRACAIVGEKGTFCLLKYKKQPSSFSL